MHMNVGVPFATLLFVASMSADSPTGHITIHCDGGGSATATLSATSKSGRTDAYELSFAACVRDGGLSSSMSYVLKNLPEGALRAKSSASRQMENGLKGLRTNTPLVKVTDAERLAAIRKAVATRKEETVYVDYSVIPANIRNLLLQLEKAR